MEHARKAAGGCQAQRRFIVDLPGDWGYPLPALEQPPWSASMYAVIKTGGKQYRVTEGDVLRVEKLEADAGSSVKFDQVLLVADGDDVKVGAPMLKGGSVSGEVVSQGRDRKIEVIKFKRRKDYQRHYGHRQHYTEVRITGIKAG